MSAATSKFQRVGTIFLIQKPLFLSTLLPAFIGAIYGGPEKWTPGPRWRMYQKKAMQSLLTAVLATAAAVMAVFPMQLAVPPVVAQVLVLVLVVAQAAALVGAAQAVAAQAVAETPPFT